MSFTAFFEDLSGQINNLRAGRKDALEACQARVEELRTNVDNFLDTFRSDHKQMAKEQKKKLRSDDKARVKAAHELM